MNVQSLLLVALGGAFGSISRYLLSGWVLHHTVGWKFPAGTFTVNVTGCLAAGVLAALAEREGWFSPQVRLLVFTGILGGFTTFSAFGLETVYLVRRGELLVAGANVFLSVSAGLAALWLGMLSVPVRS
jgi:CrcB protein